MFHLLGLFIGSYVTGMTFLEEERLEMVITTRVPGPMTVAGVCMFYPQIRFNSRTDTSKTIKWSTGAVAPHRNQRVFGLVHKCSDLAEQQTLYQQQYLARSPASSPETEQQVIQYAGSSFGQPFRGDESRNLGVNGEACEALVDPHDVETVKEILL